MLTLSGYFRLVYGCNFAEKSPSNHTLKREEQQHAWNAKRGSMSFPFTSIDRGRVTYNELCRKCQHGCKQSFRVVAVDCPRYLSKRAKKKEEHTECNFEFMTIDRPSPPCMSFPRALTGFPVSSTAKVMYCRMLDAMLSKRAGGRRTESRPSCSLSQPLPQSCLAVP